MPEKATHALVRFRDGDKDVHEVFTLTRPTTERAEAVQQWEDAAADYNDGHAGHERFLMDLTLLAPGQEKATGGPASVPSELLPKRHAKPAEVEERPAPRGARSQVQPPA